MSTPLRRVSYAALLVLVAACGGDDPFTPTTANVAGTYTPETFTATSSTLGTVNLLALGALVDVTLAPDGTASGRLFVPGIVAGGDDVDEDLAGTWSLDGDVVTFNQGADTFIRDVDFTATENRLTGEGVFEGTTIRLVLVKSD